MALSPTFKANSGSELSYKEGLGFSISEKADITFAIPDDLQVIGDANHFHLVSAEENIAWVALK